MPPSAIFIKAKVHLCAIFGGNKLIKFATRIPVFMYLTDKREYCLKDVITQLEPELFRKVTGLTLKDFTHIAA